MRITDGNWELDHDLSIPGQRAVWKLWDGDKLIIRTDYPTEQLVRDNAAARAATAGTRMGEFAHVASVPLNIFHDSGLSEAGNQGDEKFISRWLNSSDNHAFRTRDSRV